jgi:hypothetical protein
MYALRSDVRTSASPHPTFAGGGGLSNRQRTITTTSEGTGTPCPSTTEQAACNTPACTQSPSPSPSPAPTTAPSAAPSTLPPTVTPSPAPSSWSPSRTPTVDPTALPTLRCEPCVICAGWVSLFDLKGNRRSMLALLLACKCCACASPIGCAVTPAHTCPRSVGLTCKGMKA